MDKLANGELVRDAMNIDRGPLGNLGIRPNAECPQPPCQLGINAANARQIIDVGPRFSAIAAGLRVRPRVNLRAAFESGAHGLVAAIKWILLQRVEQQGFKPGGIDRAQTLAALLAALELEKRTPIFGSRQKAFQPATFRKQSTLSNR